MANHNRAAFIATQVGVVPLVKDIPGVAKTATIEAFGRAVGRPVYVLIGSIREPADICGYPHYVERQGADGVRVASIEFIPTSWVLDLNRQPSILFFDELTCGAPTVQAGELRIMAEKVVGDTPLRADTWMMAACNPPELAAGGYDIEPPMANRLCHLDWDFDWGAWDTGMMNGLKFPTPSFPVVPQNWEERLMHWGSLVASFRRHRPALFKDMPKDRSAQSGAYPTPRSWTNATKCLAGADAAGEGGEVQHELVAGCIGTGPAGEFFTWLKALDLPDPVKLFKDAERDIAAKRPVAWKPLPRPDHVMACLSSVVNLAIEEATAGKWETAMLICNAACEQYLDVGVACAGRLAKKNVMPKGATIPKVVIDNLSPILSAAFGAN